MKEEKDRRQYAMQYWNKARELAEKAKRERETEEVERELAAEQRRCILKAKADELVKQTAAKRRAKRSESQAEVMTNHYMCPVYVSVFFHLCICLLFISVHHL